MKRLALPVLAGISHGVSDAAAGLMVAQVAMMNSMPLLDYVLMYNALAFGLQPMAGLILDRFNFSRGGASIGLVSSAIGLILAWFNFALGMFCVGIGSAFFHAGGGAVAIKATPGRASGPGIFASFGVIGLAIGAMLASFMSMTIIVTFVVALLIFAALLWFVPETIQETKQQEESILPNMGWLIFALLIAVTLRSFVWVTARTGIADYTQVALIIALCAGCGKLIGGFIADRLGWRKWMMLAMLTAALLLAFRGENMILLAVAMFFLQSITALSLAAMGRALPSSPALASSLVLGLGVLLGGIPSLMIPSEMLGGLPFIIISLIVSAVFYSFALRRVTVSLN